MVISARFRFFLLLFYSSDFFFLRKKFENKPRNNFKLLMLSGLLKHDSVQIARRKKLTNSFDVNEVQIIKTHKYKKYSLDKTLFS